MLYDFHSYSFFPGYFFATYVLYYQVNGKKQLALIQGMHYSYKWNLHNRMTHSPFFICRWEQYNRISRVRKAQSMGLAVTLGKKRHNKEMENKHIKVTVYFVSHPRNYYIQYMDKMIWTHLYMELDPPSLLWQPLLSWAFQQILEHGYRDFHPISHKSQDLFIPSNSCYNFFIFQGA